MEAKGEIALSELPRAFEQVGMEPTPEKLELVLAHLNKADGPGVTVSFAEFSQVRLYYSSIILLYDYHTAIPLCYYTNI